LALEINMSTSYIIATTAGSSLANEILEVNSSLHGVDVQTKKFSNGEIYTRPLENIRDKDVYIIASGSGIGDWNINDSVVETLILFDACKRADPKSVTFICPYFPYIRSDKKVQSREAIAAKAIARAYEPYVNRVAVVDAHFSQFQGFFEKPVDNLYSVYLFAHYLADHYLGSHGENRDDFVLVSPDCGGSKRVEHFAELLEMNYVVMNKRRDYTKSNTVLATEIFNSADASTLVNKTAIIIDDIIDSAGTITEACKTLDKFKFKDYILVATHGIFSGPALERIKNAENISRVIVSNSVIENHTVLPAKIDVLSLAELLSTYITQLQSGQSVSVLFKEQKIYDERVINRNHAHYL